MKVLYVISSSKMDGSTLSFMSLLEGVLKKGEDVVVALPNNDKEQHLSFYLDRMSIPYYFLPINFLAYPKRILSIRDIFLYLKELTKRVVDTIIATKAIKDIIQKEKIDIVHTNVGPVQCGYFAAKITRVPHVWHIREYGDLDFQMYPFPSRSSFIKKLKNSTVICITKDLIRYNDLANIQNAYVVYNGVRGKSETNLTLPKEKYFLTSSRVSPEKGFDQIIRVFSEFAKIRNDYKLKILGTGSSEYLSYLASACKRSGIQDFVEFVGFTDKVDEYMNRATALLVASPSEGFGRMTAEAAFNGCLVIGMNTAGTKEILDITGGFPYLTDEEMFSQMCYVASMGNGDYRIMAEHAQSKALSEFSKEEYVNKIDVIYRNIINQQCKDYE